MSSLLTLKQLLNSWAHGEEDCRGHIHQLCMELGYPLTADYHFSSENGCAMPLVCTFGENSKYPDTDALEKLLISEEKDLEDHYIKLKNTRENSK